uniref:Uncharacterized protein n=1 Tax=Caenorhabditis tropicalis TaxID=1561998 RepID=A0A1I7UD79_9PELO
MCDIHAVVIVIDTQFIRPANPLSDQAPAGRSRSKWLSSDPSAHLVPNRPCRRASSLCLCFYYSSLTKAPRTALANNLVVNSTLCLVNNKAEL